MATPSPSRATAGDGGSDPRLAEAFARAQVDAFDHEPLALLFRRWRGVKGASEEERLEAALEDYGHWRLFCLSRDGDAGAARAFERHWRRYAGALLGRRYTPEHIEEVTGTFFERVYRLIPRRFAWSCPFSVYLRTVLLNATRDETRRILGRRRREESLESAAAARGFDPQSRAVSPEESLLAMERAQRLERALAEIAPLDRHIVRECLLEERSGPELANLLGISCDALYQRLHRAKKRLRALLARDAVSAAPGGSLKKQARRRA